MAAVEKGLGITGLVQHAAKARYRVPDRIVNPAGELQRLTGGRYQKVGGSRAIGPWLDPDGNSSRSFQVLVEGIRRLGAVS